MTDGRMDGHPGSYGLSVNALVPKSSRDRRGVLASYEDHDRRLEC
jgi:hypothetical protein